MHPGNSSGLEAMFQSPAAVELKQYKSFKKAIFLYQQHDLFIKNTKEQNQNIAKK